LLEECTGAQIASDIFEANKRARIDEAAYRFVKTWHEHLPDSAKLPYAGVDLAPSLDYDLMRDILQAEYFARGESER
jgi:hypothetical protein